MAKLCGQRSALAVWSLWTQAGKNELVCDVILVKLTQFKSIKVLWLKKKLVSN